MPYRLAYRFLRPTAAADQINRRALEWIDSTTETTPFFLFLNYMDAHSPLYPPSGLHKRFPGFRRELAYSGLSQLKVSLRKEKRSIKDWEYDHLVSQYDATLLYLDDQLQRLHEDLDRRGLLGKTILIIRRREGRRRRSAEPA